ncbi:cation:proton antiporter [Streptantibioticus ferralitis]|uniref:Cation:proton antiporter n=1 Tax=Streptantibioticus ferralitis TaxID=236510 RepID=A0ABT5YV97_9ACTN|nr:cation:proton antiporter [Streptantibioticus ferralitis]MDF2255516.1 cation:proton antiporter [Streptantibioticus ferralitis]
MGSHTIAAGPSPGATAGLLSALALVIAAALVFAKLAQRLRQPVVVGEIVAGVVLGPSVLGLLPGDLVDVFFPPDVRPFLQVLSQLGLVLFMFGVGYQFDASHVRHHGLRITAVSLSSVALPFALGAGLAVLLAPWFERSQMKTDGVLAPALFLGAAMSITAFPVLARIIGERGLQKDRVGAIAVACAAIQDVLAWVILAVVVALANSTGHWPLVRMALASVALLAGLVWLVRPALVWALAPARPWSGALVTHALLVVGLLLSAWATEAIGLHAVFGAFAFGAVAPRAEVDAGAPEVPERIEQASLLLLPVFFVVTGLSVNLGGLGGHGALILLAVLVVACAGKFLGAAGAAGLTGATGQEATVLGVLMNARGLTELVILNVGLGLGVLDGQLFTAMVTMAIVTTVMTGPLLDRFHKQARPATRQSEPVDQNRDDRRPLVTSPDEAL